MLVLAASGPAGQQDCNHQPGLPGSGDLLQGNRGTAPCPGLLRGLFGAGLGGSDPSSPPIGTFPTMSLMTGRRSAGAATSGGCGGSCSVAAVVPARWRRRARYNVLADANGCTAGNQG